MTITNDKEANELYSQLKKEEKESADRKVFEEMENDAYIDPSEVIEHPPVAISMGEYSYNTRNGVATYPIPLVTYGNIAFVQAPPKSMKSFFVSLMAGVYLKGSTKEGSIMRGHREGRKLIHFDTEQGDFHAARSFKTPLRISKGNQEDYITYALRRYNYDTRADFIEYLLYNKYKLGEVGMVIIDGLADLVADVNSLTESTSIIQRLMTWSQERNIAIVTILHSNFGSNKPVGHLGSFMEKKAETQINLERNSQYPSQMTVSCMRSRNKDFDPFDFKLDDRGLPFVIDRKDIMDLIS